MKEYSVKKLAKLAGVSVRTLHYYDKIELLKPSTRTESGYRFYGEEEALRLQQILFFKELDFSLQEICEILDEPDFDLIDALESHKKALKKRSERIFMLLKTIDNTINHLKNGGNMLKHEELYEGLPKEKAEAYRKEAKEKWGSMFENSEAHLRKMDKRQLNKLKNDFSACWQKLLNMINENPKSEAVQEEIAKHYSFIRQFWGTAHLLDAQAEAYQGLGKLYVNDERYTTINGKSNPKFAEFLNKAMSYFVNTRLKNV